MGKISSFLLKYVDSNHYIQLKYCSCEKFKQVIQWIKIDKIARTYLRYVICVVYYEYC